ncbi:MAG: hypothetical protein WCG42_03625 [Parachlamydiaceae bacterium]
MQKILFLLSIGLITTSTPTSLSGDDAHGGVHIFLPDGEEEDADDDCCDMVDDNEERGIPPRPWFQNQKFEVYEDNGDPTDELLDDTAWPGEREEFSDILFR